VLIVVNDEPGFSLELYALIIIIFEMKETPATTSKYCTQSFLKLFSFSLQREYINQPEATSVITTIITWFLVSNLCYFAVVSLGKIQDYVMEKEKYTPKKP
jgi:hypothetical protein